MFCFLLASFLSFLVDLVAIAHRGTLEKDLELLLLRQQVRILQRKRPTRLRISLWEKLSLAVLAAKFTQLSHNPRAHLHSVLIVFKPDTVLKWHRELIRWKWTFKRRQSGGRPPLAAEIEALIVQLARENPRWGYGKLQGELLKLGHTLGHSTIRDVLKRNRVPPAPTRREAGSSWRTFLKHYHHQMVACDFFTVETVWLKTIYVLFFIELGTRRVHVAGCTASPTAAWVTQQARHIRWEMQAGEIPVHFLIHDRNAKFPAAFDTVFAMDGVTIIRTPFQAPKANAFAERWVRSVREECLDRLLIINERHLERVLTAYVGYYNHARPHQGIEQQIPVVHKHASQHGPVRCWKVLDGLIHDYYRQAA